MKSKRNVIRNTSVALVFLLMLLPSVLKAQTYQVKPGDSLYLISRRFNTPTYSLKASNNLGTDLIYPGQTLMIPTKYTVRPGDNLYLIASRYSLQLSTLRLINNLWDNNLWIGETIYLPSAQGSQAGNAYTVRSQDTLYLLAKRYGTSVQALKAANHLTSDYIYPGQMLIIPDSVPGPNVPGGNGNNSNGNSYNLSQSEIELLARLVRAEAEGESYTGQVAVAASVLNRLNDSRYPNTITEIIYQVESGIYYQYSPVLDGRINFPAGASALKAVQDALNGWDPSYGAIGFYNPTKTTNWWVKSHPVTTSIGSHIFYKN
ncbi:MAG TPA: hypothetical protein DDZ91_03065 [Firmicutes bacterium]|jgi:N-acetylmuramoyl-L-alanine amidase|nr:hypothetical protein [Bacillota bacterium]